MSATKRKKAAGTNTPPAKRRAPAHEMSMAALVEYAASNAITELFIVQQGRGAYRLEVELSWRPGRTVLTAARGGQRLFRSVDTMLRFLKSCGVTKTSFRLEIKQ